MKTFNFWFIKSIFAEAIAGGFFWAYDHHITGGIFFVLCAASFAYALIKKIIQ
jgi:hypothetical protein